MAKRRRPPEEPEVDAAEPDQVQPLDVDGVRTVAVVTILWAVAFLLLVLRMDALQAEGRGWWIWTCLAGVGLGLLGLEYARKRRDAIEAEREEAAEVEAPRADDDAPDDDAHESGVIGGEVLTRGEVLARDADAPGRAATAPDSVTRPMDTGNLPPVRPATTPRQGGEGRPGPQPHGADAAHGRPAWSGEAAAPAARPSTGDRGRPAAPGRPAPPDRPAATSERTAAPSRPAPTERPAATAERPAPVERSALAPARPDPAERSASTERMAAAAARRRSPAVGPAAATPQRPDPAERPGPAARPAPPATPPPARGQASGSELLGEPVSRSAQSMSDDEPLLDTTFGSRRPVAHEPADDDSTEGGGQYRGRRARRSDTA